MKRNLRFGKTLSVVLFLMICFTSAKSFAQTQVATLQHGDEISAFYGVNALIAAHEAAVDGDVITLSSGQFHSADLTKAITLRGAGVEADTNTYNTPTYVTGDFTINIPNETLMLNVEGIFFQNQMNCVENDLNHATFTKCNIEQFDVDGTGVYGLYDVHFINCRVHTLALRVVSNVGSDVSIINSVIGSLVTYNGSTNYTNVYNSVVGLQSYNYRLYMYNSILLLGGFANFAYNSYAYNCIIFNSLQFVEPSDEQNCYHISGGYGVLNQIFETPYSGFSYSYDYALTDEIINSFHGTDGSQVGIYGGAMPYNPRPSYIVPHNTTVSGQSNVDGTLNVEIEVINEEK